MVAVEGSVELFRLYGPDIKSIEQTGQQYAKYILNRLAKGMEKKTNVEESLVASPTCPYFIVFDFKTDVPETKGTTQAGRRVSKNSKDVMNAAAASFEALQKRRDNEEFIRSRALFDKLAQSSSFRERVAEQTAIWLHKWINPSHEDSIFFSKSIPTDKLILYRHGLSKVSAFVVEGARCQPNAEGGRETIVIKSGSDVKVLKTEARVGEGELMAIRFLVRRDAELRRLGIEDNGLPRCSITSNDTDCAHILLLAKAVMQWLELEGEIMLGYGLGTYTHQTS